MAWQKDYVRDFNASVPTWGMAGAPLVDGNLLICLVGGEPDAKLVAFDKLTGEEIWRSLSSDWEPGYNQPIIIDAAGVRQSSLSTATRTSPTVRRAAPSESAAAFRGSRQRDSRRSAARSRRS